MQTVLVVDNHAGFRRSIRRYLEMSGMAVLEAESGSEALQIMASEPVSIVLTDLNMPQMSGIDLIFAIRTNAKYDKIPVFVLSVTRSEARVSEAIDAGATGYLQKPFDLDEFLAQARPYLDKE